MHAGFGSTAVANALAAELTLEDTTRRVLRALGDALDLALAAAWRSDPAGRELSFVDLWARPGPGDAGADRAGGPPDRGRLRTSRAGGRMEDSERRRRMAMSAMLQAEEHAKAQLASDLHDDTIQVMTATLLSLERVSTACRAGDLTRIERATDRPSRPCAARSSGPAI